MRRTRLKVRGPEATPERLSRLTGNVRYNTASTGGWIRLWSGSSASYTGPELFLIALHSIISSAFQPHGFERILIIVPVSPSSQARADGSMNTSLTRQARSLTNVCSRITVPVRRLEAAHVAVCRCDFAMLEKRICVQCIQVEHLAH